ncbi:MAG: nitroreductase family protein [Methylocystaceae bacterium]
MDFFEVIKKRRAVRAYKSDPVSREDILKILEAAHAAPSGKNLQSWEFIVVSGAAKQKLGESYGKIGEAYTADWEDPASREAFINYSRTYGGAPVIIVVLADTAPEPGLRKMHLEGGCAAMENLVLAAAALNLGTCWMTGPLQDEPTLRQLLNIPENKQFVAVTPLGHPLFWPEPPVFPVPDYTQKIRWVE